MTTHITDTKKNGDEIEANVITVSGNRTGKLKRSQKVEFRFWIDEKLVHTEKVQFQKKSDTVTYNYELKPVPANKSFYKLKYGLYKKKIVGDKLLGKVHKFKVWPGQGILIVKNKDGDAIDDFKFTLKQDAPSRSGKAKNEEIDSGENGKYTFDLNLGSRYAIKAVPPWEITSWVKGKASSGSQREIKAKLCVIAEFVGPLGMEKNGTDPLEIYDQEARNAANAENPTLKQYVNLATSREGWDAKGHEVIIEIGAEGDQNRNLEDKAGGSGVFVNAHIKFSGVGGNDKKNKRNSPKTKPKAGLNLSQGNITTVADGKEYKCKVELDSPDKTGRFKVILGYAGGDTCEIKIGGTSKCSDATLNFVNWRKLEYELLYPDIMDNLTEVNGMNDIPANIKSHVKSRLGKVFIEYDFFKSQEFTKDNMGDNDFSFVKSQFLSEGMADKDRFYMTSHLKKVIVKNDFPVQFASPQPDYRMKVILAHKAFSHKEIESMSKKMTSLSKTFKGKKHLLEKSPKDGSENLQIGTSKWIFQYKKSDGNWTSSRDTNHTGKAPLELIETDDTSRDTGNIKFFRVRSGGKKHDIKFEKVGEDTMPDDVTVSEKTDLETWVNDKLNSQNKANLKSAANKLEIRIAGDTSDNTRLSAVKTAVQDAFDDKLKICDKPGRDWNGKCFKGKLKKDWFTFENCKELKLTLPSTNDDDPGKMIGADARIKVKFDIYGSGSINGSAGEYDQIMTLPSVKPVPDDEASRSKASTVCHELGHRMGMTIVKKKSKISPGMPAAKHVDDAPAGDYYSNKTTVNHGYRKVHNGAHCAHGVPDTSTADLIKNNRGDCIMYGSGTSSDDRQSFCDTCKDYIKARKLTKITGSWSSRAAKEY